MNDAVAELVADLERRGNKPVSAADLLQTVRTLGQLFESLQQHRQTLVDTVQEVNDNRGFITALEQRLQIAEDLPTEAPFGALIRIRGDQTGTLYLGNGYRGNGTPWPLTKLVPTPLY